jgi:hypothetical protein
MESIEKSQEETQRKIILDTEISRQKTISPLVL